MPSLAPGVLGGVGVVGLEGIAASVDAGVSDAVWLLGAEVVLESPELPELPDGDKVLGVQATMNNRIHK
jgi:septum formation inhibitor-activating ATPase MinD